MAPRFRQLPLFENENAIDMPNRRKPIGNDYGGAIGFNTRYREMAKTDTDFDRIQDNDQFQVLVR
jgi:hypothetical protein